MLRLREDTRSVGGAFGASLEWLADPAEQQRRRVGIQIWAEALTNPGPHALVLRGIAKRDLLLERVRRAQAERAVPERAVPERAVP